MKDYNIEVGDKIRQCRKVNNITMKELGEAVNLSESTIQRYESGQIKTLDINLLKQIAKVLRTTPAYLMGWEDDATYNYDNIYPINTKKLPLLGEIACGEPIYCDEEKGRYFEVQDNIDADFCLIVHGDSMIGARIYDGDIVLVRSQPTVENGEIGVFIIDDEATLKRIYKSNDVYTLVSENPAYQPIVVTNLEKCRILGKAVAFQSLVK